MTRKQNNIKNIIHVFYILQNILLIYKQFLILKILIKFRDIIKILQDFIFIQFVFIKKKFI